MEGLSTLIRCPDEGSNVISSCDVEVSPTSITPPKTGGTYNFTLTAANDTPYPSTVSDSWAQIVSGPASGSGTMVVHVDANTACMERETTITVCGVTITITQAAATTCCDVTVSPSSFPALPKAASDQVISVTLIDPTIPSASTDVDWLHVSLYVSDDATHGHFDVHVDAAPDCIDRTGHVMICDETVTFHQPFDVAFTPSSATISGNAQNKTIVASGTNFASIPNSLHLTVTSKYDGRTIAACNAGYGIIAHSVGNTCLGQQDTPSIFVPNNLYLQNLFTDVPIGITLLITGEACDGTEFVITQVPKCQGFSLVGDGATSIQTVNSMGNPVDVDFGPHTSGILVPEFDPEYPVFGSMEWSLPYNVSAVAHTIDHWTVTTPGGHTATFLGADPGPYFLTGPQIAEVLAIIATHASSSFAAVINIFGIQGKPPFYIINPIGATTLSLSC